MKNILRIIFLILIILTSLIIFGFSAQNGEKSGSLSKTMITKISDIIKIDENKKESFILKGEGIIRKLAHFTIYTSLGIWSMAFISTFNIKQLNRIIYTTIWGIIYAGTDEIHQLFVSGRNGSILDVILDTTGVIFGICIVVIILKIKDKIKLKNRKA